MTAVVETETANNRYAELMPLIRRQLFRNGLKFEGPALDLIKLVQSNNNLPPAAAGLSDESLALYLVLAIRQMGLPFALKATRIGTTKQEENKPAMPIVRIWVEVSPTR